MLNKLGAAFRIFFKKDWINGRHFTSKARPMVKPNSVNKPVKSLRACVGVCGFQEKGFEIPDGYKVIVGDFELTFIGVESHDHSLERFDGVIVASGAFETIERKTNISGAYFKVEYNQAALLRREREVHNLLGKGGWVCAFVDEIVDQVTSSSYRTQDLSEIDLVKKLLNTFDIKRGLIGGGASVLDCKADEFKSYFKNHAAAHTVFTYFNKDFKKLGTSGYQTVALACDARAFFLPFHFVASSSIAIERALETAINGVLDYKSKNEIVLPSWLEEIEFVEEKMLITEVSRLRDELAQVEKKAHALKIRKSILTTSGEILVEQVNGILTDFFGLKTETIEKRIEDLKIIDRQTADLLVAVEIKGVNSGVKREHINQVDSHRERLGVSGEIPGLLIINDNAKTDGTHARWAIEVDKDQIKHALKLNVTVIRTIDLLLFIKALEGQVIENRRKFLMEQISQGGGWLRFVDGSLNLITNP